MCTRLRGLDRHLILIPSARDQVGIESPAEAGADDYAVKPFSLDEPQAVRRTPGAAETVSPTALSAGPVDRPRSSYCKGAKFASSNLRRESDLLAVFCGESGPFVAN